MPNLKTKYRVLSTKYSAFTLIEILVSMTIIGFLFSFGYASFRDFSRRQALVGVVKQVQGDLRLAQQKALSGEKPSGCIIPTVRTLNGYNFFVGSTTTYKIQADCTVVGAVDVKTVTLPAGVTISVSTSDPINHPLVPANTLKFKVLGRGMNMDPGIWATIILAQTGVPDSQVVTVTAGGEIK